MAKHAIRAAMRAAIRPTESGPSEMQCSVPCWNVLWATTGWAFGRYQTEGQEHRRPPSAMAGQTEDKTTRLFFSCAPSNACSQSQHLSQPILLAQCWSCANQGARCDKHTVLILCQDGQMCGVSCPCRVRRMDVTISVGLIEQRAGIGLDVV